MDAAEIAYNSDPTKDAITKLTMWVIGGGVEFGPDDVELVLDALEQARKDCEELVEATAEQTAACERLVEAASAMKEEFKSAISQRDQAQKERDEARNSIEFLSRMVTGAQSERDQAQQSAKDARAMLEDLSKHSHLQQRPGLVARIEAMLEQKP